MNEAPRGFDRWTAERVGEAMVEAFRVLPSMPVYSPRRAEFVPVLPGQDPSPLDVLALSERVLGRSTPDRRILLVWARSLATEGEVGGSVRQYCIERDMPRSTFDRRRRQACALIANEMNRLGDEALVTLGRLSSLEEGPRNERGGSPDVVCRSCGP